MGSALLAARVDKDYFVINGVREIFAGPDGMLSGGISWDEFQRKLETPAMREYFKALDVDPSEAEGLFRLLDLDNSGSIDAEEFLNGCLRLHGPAKALDLALLMREVRRIESKIQVHAHWMERAIMGLGTPSQTISQSTQPLQIHPCLHLTTR